MTAFRFLTAGQAGDVWTISIGTVDPLRDDRGWRFTLDEGGRDPVLGIERLQEAFFKRFTTRRTTVTLSAIVDVPSDHRE